MLKKQTDRNGYVWKRENLVSRDQGERRRNIYDRRMG